MQFPWGSLLRGVATGDALIMGNLRRICSTHARLQITIGLDAERDRSEWERLELSQISVDYVRSVLTATYKTAGFELVEVEELSSPDQLQTSWARRLRGRSSRSFVRIGARAV
jgi:16S rRNA (adenine(1408)-N(1))-methyltransferase